MTGSEAFAVEPREELSVGTLRQPAALDLLDVRSRFRTMAGDQLTQASILRAEVALARRFTILLASESDRGWLTRNGADPSMTKVVPHGADRRFLEIVPDPGSRSVLFVGNLHYPPNLEGLRWFLQGCWPAMRGDGIQLRLVLFGAERAGTPPDTTVFADVKDVRPHYAAAAIAVAPLLSARGTQFKVLEAMAAGLPVVCTTPVAQGLFDDHPAIVCDRPDEFAAACRALLADAARRRERGEGGRAYVRRHHDWAQSARLVSEILVR